ncbi:MAG: tetratricopeptide repeat protein, partial [Verrucomicrobia bacterium]|nr:tetratricopeptide repeat protein [Verrucomicrobiota bacterium]
LAIFFTPVMAAWLFKAPKGAAETDLERAEQTGEGRILRWLTSRYEAALRHKPALAEAHCNLGLALAESDRLAEAVAHGEEALRLRPDYPEALNNLGVALFKLGRFAEAAGRFEAALRVKPGLAEAHNALGVALIRLNRRPEAVAHFEVALRSRPDYPQARDNLARLQAPLARPAPDR